MISLAVIQVSHMIPLLPIFLAGFVAGMVHVVTGPDHLVAVAPLALNQREKTWFLGIRWGFGHATGVVLVAVLAGLFRELLPVELFSERCERLVGVMLIGIGIWALRKALRFNLHVHEHTHHGYAHKHMHAHTAMQHQSKTHIQLPHAHNHAAVAVGIMHGLAGGSHFLGVLPALAMPTHFTAGIYLFSFGIGTVLTMAVFSFAFGWMGWKLTNSGITYFKGVMATCASAAILVGGYWLVF